MFLDNFNQTQKRNRTMKKMTGTMMAGINTDTYSWTGSGTAVVVVPFILHHYLNEADAYTRIFVAEKPPMDKETVSGLRKNNGDILNCCGSFSGCYSFQTFSGFLVIRSLCLYSSTFKLYNNTFFLCTDLIGTTTPR